MQLQDEFAVGHELAVGASAVAALDAEHLLVEAARGRHVAYHHERVRPEARHAQSQRLSRKNAVSASARPSMKPTIPQKAAPVSKPGKWTFMPKMPVISVSGRRITVTTVSTRRTSFWRCE